MNLDELVPKFKTEFKPYEKSIEENEVKKLVLLFNENDEDCYYYEQSNIQLWIDRFKKIREIYRQQTGQ